MLVALSNNGFLPSLGQSNGIPTINFSRMLGLFPTNGLGSLSVQVFFLPTITKNIQGTKHAPNYCLLNSKAFMSSCFYWFCTPATSLAHHNDIIFKGNSSYLA